MDKEIYGYSYHISMTNQDHNQNHIFIYKGDPVKPTDIKRIQLSSIGIDQEAILKMDVKPGDKLIDGMFQEWAKKNPSFFLN
ncbi:MAG: hypothetical protein HPY53_12465 [Brevinematales bacterium]|nr:hypothetical protein [Brevinematales bacterium]